MEPPSLLRISVLSKLYHNYPVLLPSQIFVQRLQAKETIAYYDGNSFGRYTCYPENDIQII
jgi:hypothetical protein